MSARRLALTIQAVLVALVGVLSLSATASLAAAPEVPEVSVLSPVPATAATVNGVLDPKVEGGLGTYELGTYEFLYKASKTTCEGEGKAPVSPGISMGGGKEAVSQTLPGLQANTEYTVCLLARNGTKGEHTVSLPLTFMTAIPPETPETSTLKIEPVGSTTSTLNGVLNPAKVGDAGSYEFLYKASKTECKGGEASGGSAVGKEKEAVLNQIGGLQPNTEYAVCLLARNKAGETALSAPVTFTTLSEEPGVTGESVLHLGTRGASVTAQVDSGGLETSYSVQYGTSAAYGSESSTTTISALANTATVSLSGLAPDTEYHVRFVVANKDGTAVGHDMMFTTYPAEAPGLPDGRVYELVSQSGDGISEVYIPGTASDRSLESYYPYESSPSGNAVTFAGSPSQTGGSGESTRGTGNQFYASRSPQGSWTEENITPHELAAQYVGFSSDLSTGFLFTLTEPPLVTTEEPLEVNINSPAVPTLYSRSLDQKYFRPIFTKVPSNRLSGNKFLNYGGRFGAGIALGIDSEAPTYVGSSTDLSYILFEANEDFLEGAGGLEAELSSDLKKEAEAIAESIKLVEEEDKLARQDYGNRIWEVKGKEARLLQELNDNTELYIFSDERLSLANLYPNGKVDPGVAFGGLSSFSHAVSSDGSRIFWTSLEPHLINPGIVYGENIEWLPRAIYVRIDGSRTVQVSPGPAEFWTASSDGRYAFYIEEGKLWRFDVEDETRVELAGSAGGVQGVLGTNESGEDGAYLYFVTQEKLSGEENGAKQEAVGGEDNLYVDEPDPNRVGQSKIVFIATLSPGDSSDWSPSLGSRTSNFTPDGSGLVFESSRNMTGHPYLDEGSGEVYVFDAHDGSLICASCRPQASGGTLTGANNYSGSLNPTYTYRWISEDGSRVFFDSSAPLVAGDVSGRQNVYEWERDGNGACVEAAGCDYLLSNGVGEAASFVDASSSGNDVFFATRESLVPEDGNESVDLYDARVDGNLPVSAPQCTGTGCQGVPAPAPPFATPASLTFAGVGNFPPPSDLKNGTKMRSLTRAQKLSRALKACHQRRSRKQRAVCEIQARKLYKATVKPKNAKPASRETK